MLTRPDQGWAWVVMVSSFGAHIISGCFLYAVGILHIALLDRFKEDVTKTSWAGALFLCLYSSGSPLSGMLVNRYSCRVSMIVGSLIMCIGFIASALLPTLNLVIVSFGGIAGLGAGLTYSSSVVVVGFNFEKKRNLAAGFAVSGCGVGTFLMAPLLQASRQAFGNTGLFYICAGISLHHCVFGALFFPSYLESHRKGIHKEMLQKEKKSKIAIVRHVIVYFKTLKNIPLVSLCLSMLFANIGIYLIYVHFPEYVVTTNSTPMQASFLLSVSGVCSCVSRILTGMASNADNIDETIMYFGTFGLLGISTVLFPLYATTYSGQAVFSIFLGLYSGCCYSVLNTLTVQIAGIVNLATAFGLILFATGVGTLVGPPMAGFIVDSGGSYENSFIVAGLTILMGSILGATTACSRRVTQEDATKRDSADNIKDPMLKNGVSCDIEVTVD